MDLTYFNRFTVVLLAVYFILLPFRSFGFQQIQLKGKLLSKNSGEPIVYATVLDLTLKTRGTTSQKDGKFELVLPESSANDEIQISSIGYHSIQFKAKELQEHKVIYLEEKTYSLPDVMVYNKQGLQSSIGEADLPFYSQTGGMSVSSPGFAHGAFLIPKRKHANGYLDSLQVFVTGEFYNSPFVLRIVRPKQGQKVKESQLYPIGEFQDLISETVSYHPLQPGWFTIDLSNMDVPLSKEGIFVLFIQLDTSQQYWQRKGDGSIVTSENSFLGASYGHEIALQKRASHKVFDALFTGKALGIIEKGPSQLAVVLHYTYQD